MARAGKEGTPVFLVGGKPEVLAQTEAKLRNQWNVNIVGSQDGYFKPEQRQALFERIHASGAQIVTVAMGSPKQEIIMRDCRLVHPDALYMGVGGTYDVFTGHVKRAPKIWQTLGLGGSTACFRSRAALSVSFVCCVIYAGTTPATYDFPLFVKRRVVTPSPVSFLLHKAFKFLMLYLPFLLNYENICNTRCTHNDNR